MARKFTFTVLAATLALSVMPNAMANESGGGCCAVKSKTVATEAKEKSGGDCCSVKSKSEGATVSPKEAASINGSQSKTRSTKQKPSMSEQMKKNPDMKM